MEHKWSICFGSERLSGAHAYKAEYRAEHHTALLTSSGYSHQKVLFWFLTAKWLYFVSFLYQVNLVDLNILCLLQLKLYFF